MDISPSCVALCTQAIQDANMHARDSPTWQAAQDVLRVELKKLMPAPGLEERVLLFTSGAVDMCMDVVRATDGQHRDETIKLAWRVIADAMTTNSANSEKELISVRMGLDRGVLELAVWELGFEPQLRMEGRLMDIAFICILQVAGNKEFAPKLVETDVIQRCLSLIYKIKLRMPTNKSLLDSALATLMWLSISLPTSLLPYPGLVETVFPFVGLLHFNGDSDVLFMCGMRAIRLLLRLMDKEMTMRTLHHNPIILDAYEDIVTKVLVSGPGGSFEAFGIIWRLSTLAQDLVYLANNMSDKSLFARFVPLVVEMVALYLLDDLDLIYYGLTFLAHVTSLDKSCRLKLLGEEHYINHICVVTRAMKNLNAECVMALKALTNVAFPMAKETVVLVTTSPVVVVADDDDDVEPSTAVPPPPTPPIVMISHHDKSTLAQAQVLSTLMKEHGYEISNMPMGVRNGDMQETMSALVQQCDLMIVLLCHNYSESSDCRLQYHYAVKCKKPCVFVICEDSFEISDHPWLTVAPSPPTPPKEQKTCFKAFSPAMVEAQMTDLLHTVQDALAGRS